MSATTVVSPFTGSFTVDPDHSSAGFAVRHMGVSMFRGSFADITGTVAAAPDGTLSIEGAAQVRSISIVSPADLRGHVLGPDFFDADVHEAIVFASGMSTLDADGTISVAGSLTIRNVTRPVVATGRWVAPVEDPYGNTRAAIELAATIDRRDFGMTWNMPLPKGGDALATLVTLTVQLELIGD
jgi:polyisoprenoid-binding protein YceI